MANAAMTWIDASGTSWPLNGETYYRVGWGRTGAMFPPVSMIEQVVPLLDGSRNRGVIVAPRTVRLPMLIKGTDPVSLIQAYRAIAAAMNPKRGDGTLQVTSPDGTVRNLTCSLIGGLEGDESQGVSTPNSYNVGVVLHAADPYWYDVTATQLTFASPAVAFLSTTFFPVMISSSGVFSSFSVMNAGDVEAWPTVTISGPGVNPVITNTTTGKSLTLTITLIAGNVLTINTAPGVKTVTKQDGSNQYGAVAVTSNLWPFVTGTNAVTVALTGTTGASSVQVAYNQRWLGV